MQIYSHIYFSKPSFQILAKDAGKKMVSLQQLQKYYLLLTSHCEFPQGLLLVVKF